MQSEFKNCQAHYGKWNSIGQDVSNSFTTSLQIQTLIVYQAEYPTITADTQDNLELWKEFFEKPAIQFILCVMNMVLERLDPDFVKELKKLNASLRKRKDGKYLLDNPSYFINLAIHYNQDGVVHTDGKSLHSGWDLIQAFRRFLGCKLKFPGLNTEVNFYPTDLGFVRGAGLQHWAAEWHGAGRMVLVPFVERRLYGYQASRRPRQFRTFYENDCAGLKNAILPKPLCID